MFEKQGFREELKSYYFLYRNFFNLPKTEIDESQQHEQYHSKFTEQIEKLSNLEEIESLKILWDFKFDLDNSVYNIKQFVGLPNLLDAKRTLLDKNVFFKFVKNLKTAQKEASITYKDQNIGLILRGEEVLGFIATSN